MLQFTLATFTNFKQLLQSTFNAKNFTLITSLSFIIGTLLIFANYFMS